MLRVLVDERDKWGGKGGSIGRSEHVLDDEMAMEGEWESDAGS